MESAESAAAERERVEHVPRLNFTDICQPRAAILQLTPPLRAAPAQSSTRGFIDLSLQPAIIVGQLI